MLHFSDTQPHPRLYFQARGVKEVPSRVSDGRNVGKKGEGWVIGQLLIGALAFVSALLTRGAVPFVVALLGIALIVVGLLVLVLAVLHLGENLTVMPRPRADKHSLVTSGVYALVRHPIYAGVLLAAFGWGIVWGSLLSILLSVVLLVWLDLKSRQEEKWLIEQYPEYASYQSRVKKLVPFVY